MLFTANLLIDSKGISIFNRLKHFLSEHRIPQNNINVCASDGSPIVGRYGRISSLVKPEIPHQILSVHSMIDRQHLVGKPIYVRLNDTLQFVIKTVNKLK